MKTIEPVPDLKGCFPNMIVAGTANKSFKEEIEQYNIYRQVHDGETIYALVAFRDIGKDEISLRLK
jgi:hypothetical protein